MKKTMKRRLGLEQLEDRLVPASILYSGGNLTVSNPTQLVGSDQHTNLRIVQQASGNYAGQFEVFDNTSPEGYYKITGDLTIVGTNRPDLITVTLDNTSSIGYLPGNLTISGAAGNDTIAVDGAAGNTGTETIRGSVYIDSGLGDDQTLIGQNKNLTIRGNSTFIGNSGNDALTFGGGTATDDVIRGAVSIYSTQTITLTSTNILGSALITLNMSPTSSTPKVSNINLNYNASSTFGPLTINGGNMGDSFTFDPASTLGTTVITTGAGDNALSLGATVNGNFSYKAGNGANNISVMSSAAIHGLTPALGDLNITLGNGPETYSFGDFEVDHNMTLIAGTSDQMVSSFGGAIGGTLTIDFNTGDNLFTLGDGVNGSASLVVYNLVSGNGGNTLNIDPPAGDGTNNVIINVPTAAGNYGATTVNITATSPGTNQTQVVTLNGANASSVGSIAVNFTNYFATLGGPTNIPPGSTATNGVTQIANNLNAASGIGNSVNATYS